MTQFFTVVFALNDEERTQEDFANALENAIDGWSQLKILTVVEND